MNLVVLLHVENLLVDGRMRNGESGLPCLVISVYKNCATQEADLSGIAAASGHFVE